MTSAELTVELSRLDERTNNLQRQLDKQDKTLDEVRKQHEQLNSAVVRIQQQFTDHIAHVEKWDSRRWATIGFFIAGLISLVANLVLVLARK